MNPDRRSAQLAGVIGTVLACYPGSASAIEFEFENGGKLGSSEALASRKRLEGVDTIVVMHSEPKVEDKAEDPKRQEAIDLVVATVEALVAERGEDEKIWGSMVKQTLKRRKPGFSESYYGYRSFGELLEDAMKHKLLILERDEKSGQHIIRLSSDD